MQKLTIKQITKGMVFEIIGYNQADYAIGLGLGMQKDPTRQNPLGIQFNPPIPSTVKIIRPPHGTGGKLVDWSIIDPSGNVSSDVWSSYWSEFKQHSEYVSGIIAPKQPITLTAEDKAGTFVGFDVAISHTEIKTDTLKGFPELIYTLEFVGDNWTGAKRLPTQLINKIKQAPKFKEHVESLIHQELQAHATEYNAYYPQITDEYPGYNYLSMSKYNNGKVELTTYLAKDQRQTQARFNDILAEFIQSRSCMSFTMV